MHYDFHQLSDIEFETLTADLLGMLFEARIDRYKSGKDSGIDGIFYTMNGKENIIQCKHRLKSGYNSLISSIKKEEIEKVKKLNPTRYIFSTSLPLSKKNKEEIRDLFSPYILSIDDIFGQENLNDLLGKFPEIEKRHYKLWISSSTVLEAIIGNIVHNDIYGRSKSEMDRIHKRASKYVITSLHHDAIKKIEDGGVIIITGEPGLGKTTLAENISLFFAAQGFEFIYVHKDLTEAEKVYNYNKSGKQLFFFDDFLGANYLEAIQNKEDAHIVHFIEKITEDKDKIFILTSRSGILSKGILSSQYLGTCNIDKNKYVLSVKNLTELDKGMILYSQIYFSKLPDAYISEIKRDSNYKKIINHRNYSPRLIEYIVDHDRIVKNGCTPEEYIAFIMLTLSNPKDIWEHPFNNQLNSFERAIIFLITYNSGTIYEKELRIAYDNFILLSNIKNNSNIDYNFELVCENLTGSFINRNVSRHPKLGAEYTLFNPSIGDFILEKYNKDSKKLIDIFSSLHTVSSLEKLSSLRYSKFINNICFQEIGKTLFDKEDWKEGDYGISLCHVYMGIGDFDEKIYNLLTDIYLNPILFSEGTYGMDKFLTLLEYYDEKIGIKSLYFLDIIVDNLALSGEEIRTLGGLLDKYPASDNLKEKVVTDLDNHLYAYLKENDSVAIQDYIDEDGDIDKNGILDMYKTILYDEFSYINISNTIKDLGVNLDDIAYGYYDHDNLMQRYSDWFEEYGGRQLDYDKDDYYTSITGAYGSSESSIDDIFSRL